MSVPKLLLGVRNIPCKPGTTRGGYLLALSSPCLSLRQESTGVLLLLSQPFIDLLCFLREQRSHALYQLPLTVTLTRSCQSQTLSSLCAYIALLPVAYTTSRGGFGIALHQLRCRVDI